MRYRDDFPFRSSLLIPLIMLTTGSANAQGFGPEIAYFPECDDCGRNAATVGDNIIFDNMHAGGRPNNGGVKIDQAWLCSGGRFPNCGTDGQPGRPVKARLKVEKDRLSAFLENRSEDPTLDGVSGHDLHERLRVELSHPRTGARYELFVTYTKNQRFRGMAETDVNESNSVVAYRFAYRMITPPPLKPLSYLCTGTPAYQETYYFAIVWAGDMVDNKKKQVLPPAEQPGWFNLACSGTALSKLHLFRHSQAAFDRGLGETDRSQRTALLKLLTADYCGTGSSFTKNGQELRYMDAAGLVPSYPAINFEDDLGDVEAIWDKDGRPICLNTPRLTDRYNATLVRLSCALRRDPLEGISTSPRIPDPRPTIGLGTHTDTDPPPRSLPSCTADQIRNWSRDGYLVSVLSPLAP